MNDSRAAAELQQRLQDKSQNTNDCGTWGDIMPRKDKEIIRIAFQNINGFGITKKDCKAERIREFMEENSIDIFGMAEMNVNWRIVGKKNTINDLTRGWFENQRVNTAYNQHDRTCQNYQPGGTAIITRNETSLRVLKEGQDERKLGRWCWQLFRGKDDIRVRMVSIYFPTIPRDKKFGHKKVYSQQQKALLQMKITESVWATFWTDLTKEIDKWIQEGDQLILGGDWNIDVRKEQFQQRFRERNLIPAIISRHGKEGPGTYNNGSAPIDEIFISSTLSVIACGYLDHGSTMGDHRPI